MRRFGALNFLVPAWVIVTLWFGESFPPSVRFRL